MTICSQLPLGSIFDDSEFRALQSICNTPGTTPKNQPESIKFRISEFFTTNYRKARALLRLLGWVSIPRFSCVTI